MNTATRPRGDVQRQTNLDAIRSVVKDRSAWGDLLREERRFIEFMERCNALLDYVDKLKADFDDLSLVHEAILEHATSIENEMERYNREIGEDLAVAQRVQRALLPDAGHSFHSVFEVAIHHRQLAEVGGDYYDFFSFPDGRYAVGVYDISGHGVSSALIMAFLKSQFAHATKDLRDPGAIVDWVNRSAYSFLREVRRYSTVNFVVFTPSFLRYVSGGGYGLLVRRGAPRHFNRVSNFIGLRQKPFQEFELPFESNDVLALYTDGMFEAQGANGESYSVQRLNDIVVKHCEEPVQTILDRCIEDYTRFRVADTDDITLIILRRCA
ncbi:PP2C family protein-serine/threonine phosphatase [Chondromyces crocatus]|uniref:Phosphoserine phosphatase n=1 Tax=Chondromyces crocatus TaxID=52 RepID=A0A0K1EDS4_CHOCO|nr:PP2C family protein-serine/threonine phosphatase [Chondromyces crocatus]AKT39021.1 phosphoserine phosphatase [Chondromyces crocatus]